MSLYDTQKICLLSKSLTTTATDSQIINMGANYVTQITSITLKVQTGGATKRIITGYIYGINTVNEFFIRALDPSILSGTLNIILTGLDFLLINSETMSFKVDTGTDVNIIVNGIREQVN